MVMLLFFYRPKHHEIKGLNADKFIAVTFHCILPKPLWVWDEMSCMYMRFEGYFLGDWEHNIGDFKVERCVFWHCKSMSSQVHVGTNSRNYTALHNSVIEPVDILRFSPAISCKPLNTCNVWILSSYPYSSCLVRVSISL